MQEITKQLSDLDLDLEIANDTLATSDEYTEILGGEKMTVIGSLDKIAGHSEIAENALFNIDEAISTEREFEEIEEGTKLTVLGALNETWIGVAKLNIQAEKGNEAITELLRDVGTVTERAANYTENVDDVLSTVDEFLEVEDGTKLTVIGALNEIAETVAGTHLDIVEGNEHLSEIDASATESASTLGMIDQTLTRTAEYADIAYGDAPSFYGLLTAINEHLSAIRETLESQTKLMRG